MDYDLFVKHEEERKKVGNVDTISDASFNDIYNDRLTDADLKDNELKVSKPTHEELEEATDEHFTCCICGEESEGYGNNPAPVKDEGRCCDACNIKFVIPARIAALKADENE